MHPFAYSPRPRPTREGSRLAIVLTLQISLLFAALQPTGVTTSLAALLTVEASVQASGASAGPHMNHAHPDGDSTDRPRHAHSAGCPGIGAGLGCAAIAWIPTTGARALPPEPLLTRVRPLRSQSSLSPPLRPPRLVA